MHAGCEEHLETGYPELDKKLTELKELRSELEELKKTDIRELLDEALASMRDLKTDPTDIKNRFEHIINACMHLMHQSTYPNLL